jgi:hypothetical protein
MINPHKALTGTPASLPAETDTKASYDLSGSEVASSKKHKKKKLTSTTRTQQLLNNVGGAHTALHRLPGTTLTPGMGEESCSNASQYPEECMNSLMDEEPPTHKHKREEQSYENCCNGRFVKVRTILVLPLLYFEFLASRSDL